MSLWSVQCACVRLQNLPWYKTGLVSRQVFHLLSKLQNWIWPKTGQYKTCLVSNTKIESSIRATKPKPWQSHLTSETVEIFIQNEKAGLVPMQSRFWCGRLSVGTKPVLVQAQSRFWSGWFRVGTKPVLEQAQSRFWSGWFRVGTKPVLEQAHSRFGRGRLQNLYIFIFFIYIFSLHIYMFFIYMNINIYMYMYICIYTFIYTQSILVFDTMQVLYWPVLGQIPFCSFDRRCKTCLDTKLVLYQGRFCSLTCVYWRREMTRWWRHQMKTFSA